MCLSVSGLCNPSTLKNTFKDLILKRTTAHAEANVIFILFIRFETRFLDICKQYRHILDAAKCDCPRSIMFAELSVSMQKQYKRNYPPETFKNRNGFMQIQ